MLFGHCCIQLSLTSLRLWSLIWSLVPILLLKELSLEDPLLPSSFVLHSSLLGFASETVHFSLELQACGCVPARTRRSAAFTSARSIRISRNCPSRSSKLRSFAINALTKFRPDRNWHFETHPMN